MSTFEDSFLPNTGEPGVSDSEDEVETVSNIPVLPGQIVQGVASNAATSSSVAGNDTPQNVELQMAPVFDSFIRRILLTAMPRRQI